MFLSRVSSIFSHAVMLALGITGRAPLRRLLKRASV